MGLYESCRRSEFGLRSEWLLGKAGPSSPLKLLIKAWPASLLIFRFRWILLPRLVRRWRRLVGLHERCRPSELRLRSGWRLIKAWPASLLELLVKAWPASILPLRPYRVILRPRTVRQRRRFVGLHESCRRCGFRLRSGWRLIRAGPASLLELLVKAWPASIFPLPSSRFVLRPRIVRQRRRFVRSYERGDGCEARLLSGWLLIKAGPASLLKLLIKAWPASIFRLRSYRFVLHPRLVRQRRRFVGLHESRRRSDALLRGG